jgi:hypothetical protein
VREIRSLNMMQEGIIRITEQFSDGTPIGPSGVNSKWRNNCGVPAREKCKIIWSNCSVVLKSEKDALWEQMKRYYIFPTNIEHQELGKKDTIRTIGNALRRFRHGLNKFYIQTSRSPLNWFGFIKPNERNTFQQQHTSPGAITLSNKMKELNKNNKFTHRLGPSGYKVAMPMDKEGTRALCG